MPKRLSIKFPKFMRTSIKNLPNEAIFGPLQVKGDFGYNISKFDVSQLDKELFDYVRSIYSESCNNEINVSKLFEESIFTRVIRLDLEHIKPIIGLIIVTILNGSYNITHISVHKSFRKQGLAKLMLMTLGNYIEEVGLPDDSVLEPYKRTMVTVIIPEHINEVIMFFRNLKFNEMCIGSNYHMLKSTSLFVKITESPI